MAKKTQTKIKKVLITGATGFIGSHLAERLIKERLSVGIIKRKGSSLRRIKNILEKIKVYQADLKDIDRVLGVVSDFKPDAIFHLAVYYAIEHQAAQLAPMVNTNILGTVNLLQACKEFKIKLFVNTSSCFVYNKSNNRLKETSPLEPLNLYALSKIYTEDACSFYAKKYGLRCVTLRIFSPYGPGDHPRRLIPYVIKSLIKHQKPDMTSGKQKWDFIYIDDIIDAYLLLLKRRWSHK